VLDKKYIQNIFQNSRFCKVQAGVRLGKGYYPVYNPIFIGRRIEFKGKE